MSVPVFSSLSDPRVVQLLRAGKVGVVPTDTIYGLVTPASNSDGVSRLYTLKKRYQKLGTFIGADIEQLLELGLVEEPLRAVAHLWPNPISVVVPTHPGWEHLDLGKHSLAVRIPKVDELLHVLEQTGPLATSSANLFDQPPANTVAEAQAYFGDGVDFYVDGGSLAGRPASTIAKLTDDGKLEILRQGVIALDENGQIV